MLPRLSDIAISLAAIITLLCIAPLLTYTEIDLKLAGMPISLVLELLVPALFLAGAVRNQRRFLIMSVALLFFPYLEFLNSEQHVRSQRNFFGVLQVRRQKQHDGHWTELWHGSTLHGMQYSKPPLSQVATTYFSPTSPVGRFLTSNYAASHISRAALIGLGVGTLAQYGEPNWQIDYFEIDADVVEIARDSGHFTYLAQSRAPINFIIGDARLKLQEKPRANYDTIVIDAFSSDSIPIHLITLEAAELYLDRLTSNGVIAFHVTNRHLDLAPLLAALANKLNVKAVYCADLKRTDDEISAGKFVSLWVFFLRAPLEQKELSLDDPTCSVLKDGGGFRVWTDRYSNVLAAFK